MLIVFPSVSRCDPAVLVDVGVQSVVDSWVDHRINILSCVDVVPIVVSVPKQIICLSSPDTIMNLDLVGAPETFVVAARLLDKPADVSQ